MESRYKTPWKMMKDEDFTLHPRPSMPKESDDHDDHRALLKIGSSHVDKMALTMEKLYTELMFC